MSMEKGSAVADSAVPDPRINAYRPDLADALLQQSVKATSYVTPTIRQCVSGIVPVFSAPDGSAPLINQIRYGEFLDVFEERPDGFAWVQGRADRYVGYIYAPHVLSETIAALTCRICAMHAHVYAQPNLHAAIIDHLTLGSYVETGDVENGFARLASGGYIHTRHFALSEDVEERDYVYTAGRLLNVPYLCGGRTTLGIDNGGLVQLSLNLATVDDCPRDHDLQRQVYGKTLTAHWRDMKWRRGDLVFFRDHVGIMTDMTHILHASKEAMRVIAEPLVDVVLAGKEIVAYGPTQI